MNYTSIEQSRKLLKLGLNPDTADMHHATWTILEDGEYIVGVGYDKEMNEDYGEQIIPCWSVGALLDVMPTSLAYKKGLVFPVSNIWEKSIEYSNAAGDILYVTKSHDSYIDACYDMICWLLENGYINKSK